MKNILLFLSFLIIPLHAADHVYPIMSYQEYAKIQHETPYIFSLDRASQHLVYFGAKHISDPAHQQFLMLEKEWQQFLHKTGGKNCMVIVEGNKRPVRQTKDEAIRTAGGEGGFITFLAHQAAIETICPEPAHDWLIKELSGKFSLEEIAYKDFAQNMLSLIRRLKYDQSISYKILIDGYLALDQPYYSFPLTIDRMKAIHQQIFGTPFDPDNEQFFYTITNPVKDDTIINKVCRAASIMRDEHIVARIGQLIAADKNIFIVYGASHAVMQEKAVRALWQSHSNR